MPHISPTRSAPHHPCSPPPNTGCPCFGVRRLGAAFAISTVPTNHRLPQARRRRLPGSRVSLGFLLAFPGYATNPMNLRVPHPLRFLQRVGSCDPTPQRLLSSLL